jgi:hypothetical protein
VSDRAEPPAARDPAIPGREPILPSAGLCASCAHARAIRTRRGSRFVLCEASLTDNRLERYPRLPVARCHAFDLAPAVPGDPSGDL